MLKIVYLYDEINYIKQKNKSRFCGPTIQSRSLVIRNTLIPLFAEQIDVTVSLKFTFEHKLCYLDTHTNSNAEAAFRI